MESDKNGSEPISAAPTPSVSTSPADVNVNDDPVMASNTTTEALLSTPMNSTNDPELGTVVSKPELSAKSGPSKMVSVSFENINYSVKLKKGTKQESTKQILSNVSGIVAPGEVLAIMGYVFIMFSKKLCILVCN
jgi:hypothetical protein